MTDSAIQDYKIGETFKKGSFGKVKRGIHIPTNTPVAVKVLSREKISSSNMDKKIRREIRILKLFSHPNICRLYDVIYTSTDILLVMEFVNGGELYDYIVKQGRLKEDSARYVFQQIVCALEYCHYFRVVHRDLKPENILLAKNLSVKLIDFGLSNLMQDGDFLKTSCGSPNYAAPEVISGKLYAGPEIDVWSCGVVLYALLCGCLPFDEETIPLLFSKIKKGKYSIPSHVSGGAKDLLEQLLVVDPLHRLTIPQIRDHPWFLQRLPPHLAFNDTVFAEKISRVDYSLACEAAKKMGLNEQATIAAIMNQNPRETACYNILIDDKRSIEIASVGEKLASENEASFIVPNQRASDRELNLGLCLAPSPAMQVLLDTNDANLNKAAYNSNNYLPASVQESKSTISMMGKSPSTTGAFNLTRPNSSGSNLNVGSVPQVGSLRNPSNTSAPPSSFQGGSLRTGSVAKVEKMYTVEEENFILQHNIGWRTGIMTDARSNVVMGEIYATLLSMKMEWKMLGQFHIAARFIPTSSNSSPIILRIHCFRLQEKHDKGFLVDFRISKGNPFLAMDTISIIAERVKTKLG